jgi:hypothetical protein
MRWFALGLKLRLDAESSSDGFSPDERKQHPVKPNPWERFWWGRSNGGGHDHNRSAPHFQGLVGVLFGGSSACGRGGRRHSLSFGRVARERSGTGISGALGGFWVLTGESCRLYAPRTRRAAQGVGHIVWDGHHSWAWNQRWSLASQRFQFATFPYPARAISQRKRSRHFFRCHYPIASQSTIYPVDGLFVSGVASSLECSNKQEYSDLTVASMAVKWNQGDGHEQRRLTCYKSYQYFASVLW